MENAQGSFMKLHQHLYDLHKTLLHFQGHAMEEKLERKLGPYDLWHLSMYDENFVWLRSISEIIVEMDELSETNSQDPQLLSKIQKDLKELFFPVKEARSDFQERLGFALEKEPQILHHIGQLKGLLQ